MDIDIKTTLTDADGEVVKEADKVVEVATLLKRSLLSDLEHDGSAVRDKFERFELYLKLKLHDAEAAVIGFTNEELALLKRAVMVYPTLIAGQLRRLLDGKKPADY